MASVDFSERLGASPQEWPTPGYEGDGGLYPIFHALRGLAGLYGKRMITFETSDPTKIQGVCIEDSKGAELWIANLTPESLSLMLSRPIRTFATLDSNSFMAGASALQYLDELKPAPDVSTLSLSPFALARIRFA
jgi:D-apionolactonase